MAKIYQNLEQIPQDLQQKLVDHREIVEMSQKLVRLRMLPEFSQNLSDLNHEIDFDRYKDVLIKDL